MLRALLQLAPLPVAFVLALGTAACSDGAATSEPATSDAPEAPWAGRNVLLISVDTLRPDHLSLYGYARPTSPRIDAFFGAGHVYTRAYSTEGATAPSVVSILSGLYPAQHGVRLLYQRVAAELELLPDYLSAHGYQTAGVVSNNVLTDEASGLASHFDFYDDFVDEREHNREIYERRASRTTDSALYWFGEERDESRPHLLWVHYIDPHGPYEAPDDRPTEFTHDTPRPIDPQRVRQYQRVRGVTDGEFYVDRYDEEIAYMDREVGRLLDAYAERGLLENTVVVFTADHGETMMEHERYFTHGYHVWDAIVRVPLMIRAEGLTARTLDQPVSLVDLVPTLVTQLGVAAPGALATLDGMLLRERSNETSLSVESVSGKTTHRARIQGDSKLYITIGRDGTLSKNGWMDLAVDAESDETFRPGRPPSGGWAELLQWVQSDPDPRGIPSEFEEGAKLDGPKVAPGRTEEQLEALRRLGYVE